MDIWRIFIPVREEAPIKENSFEGGAAGSAGTVNYATGWGTYASPANTQYPDRFATDGKKNTADQQTGGPAGGKSVASDMPQQSKLSGAVNKIFQKKDTPSPDEIASGLQFELGRMIQKDKGRAKEIVLNNMKRDPHYYSNLHMLNIDDKQMKVDEARNIKKTELKNIFREMAEERPKKYEVKPELAAVMKDLWRKKEERSLWKHGKTSQSPNH